MLEPGSQDANQEYVLERQDFPSLLNALQARGYQLIQPWYGMA